MRVRRDLDVVLWGNSRCALAPSDPANRKSASRLGVSTPCGAVSTGRCPLSSAGYWSCRCMGVFTIRGWYIIISGCGETSTLSRGATLAACWLHESQPTVNQPAGLGFPHLAERYRPGKCRFSSPGCWACRYTAGFVIRGWDLILSGCGGRPITCPEGRLLPRAGSISPS